MAETKTVTIGTCTFAKTWEGGQGGPIHYWNVTVVGDTTVWQIGNKSNQPPFQPNEQVELEFEVTPRKDGQGNNYKIKKPYKGGSGSYGNKGNYTDRNPVIAVQNALGHATALAVAGKLELGQDGPKAIMAVAERYYKYIMSKVPQAQAQAKMQPAPQQAAPVQQQPAATPQQPATTPANVVQTDSGGIGGGADIEGADIESDLPF